MSHSSDALAIRLAAIARDAGKAILEVYHSGDAQATTKSDDSPLTLADTRAHECIVGALAELTPDIPVLSEESATAPFSERAHWNRYWLVDPLDGTKEFLSRNGEFTVNIALIENHTPVVGVVHVPVTATTYTGIVGSRAWKIDAHGLETALHTRRQPAPPLRVVGSKSHRGSSLDGYLERLGPHDLVAMGSSLKFCVIAEGNADVYPRLGPTSEWDTAAAHAVVEAAGGGVLDVTGAPLRYNAKPDVLNPPFIVFGDRSRDWLQYL